MAYFKPVTAAALLALAVWSTPVNPAVSTVAVPPGQLGVGFSVDSRWIAVEGYYSVRDRGAGAREQAWAGETPSRGATVADAGARAARQVRVVRLAAVPNLVGRTRTNFVAVRALTHAAFTVARHVVGAIIMRPGADDTGDVRDTGDTPEQGADDADRR